MAKNVIISAVFALLCTFGTCIKDTCNDEPTFLQMNAGLKESTQTSLSVDLTWLKGKNLPLSYFEQFHLITGDIGYDGSEWKNDYSRVERTIFLSDTLLEIVFHKEMINPVRDTIDLHYQFPDRRNFISCDHQGSNDDYYLDIQLLFSDNAGNPTVRLSAWKETLQKGSL